MRILVSMVWGAHETERKQTTSKGKLHLLNLFEKYKSLKLTTQFPC